MGGAGRAHPDSHAAVGACPPACPPARPHQKRARRASAALHSCAARRDPLCAAALSSLPASVTPIRPAHPRAHTHPPHAHTPPTHMQLRRARALREAQGLHPGSSGDAAEHAGVCGGDRGPARRRAAGGWGGGVCWCECVWGGGVGGGRCPPARSLVCCLGGGRLALPPLPRLHPRYSLPLPPACPGAAGAHPPPPPLSHAPCLLTPPRPSAPSLPRHCWSSPLPLTLATPRSRPATSGGAWPSSEGWGAAAAAAWHATALGHPPTLCLRAHSHCPLTPPLPPTLLYRYCSPFSTQQPVTQLHRSRPTNQSISRGC